MFWSDTQLSDNVFAPSEIRPASKVVCSAGAADRAALAAAANKVKRTTACGIACEQERLPACPHVRLPARPPCMHQSQADARSVLVLTSNLQTDCPFSWCSSRCSWRNLARFETMSSHATPCSAGEGLPRYKCKRRYNINRVEKPTILKTKGVFETPFVFKFVGLWIHSVDIWLQRPGAPRMQQQAFPARSRI